MILRVVRNELQSGLVKSADFENQALIDELAPFMTSLARISLIAKIVALVCHDNALFREQVRQNDMVLRTILEQVTENVLQISDECLENCLNALAESSTNHKENSLMIYNYPHFLDHLVRFLRHPDRQIKLHAAKILTHLNQYHKLSADLSQCFRWIMMQMIALLPQSFSDTGLIAEICGIISSIALVSKDKRHLQKVAGDIQAIEKISELLLSLKSSEQFD